MRYDDPDHEKAARVAHMIQLVLCVVSIFAPAFQIDINDHCCYMYCDPHCIIFVSPTSLFFSSPSLILSSMSLPPHLPCHCHHHHHHHHYHCYCHHYCHYHHHCHYHHKYHWYHHCPWHQHCHCHHYYCHRLCGGCGPVVRLLGCHARA